MDGSRSIDINLLSSELRAKVPEIQFALLFGSAKGGTVAPEGDLDIAVYLSDSSYQTIARILEVTDTMIPGANTDIAILNSAGPILRFEALNGRLLFAVDMDQYAGFFSLTCREYEDETWWRKRQLAYRGIL